MSKEEALNVLIKDSDTNKISDGYHTFGELYEHRIVLFIALCLQVYWSYKRTPNEENPIWKTVYHSDGSVWEGWFLLGMFKEKGKQITYHLPIKYWDQVTFAEQLIKAPDFDGHTSEDVLKRLIDF